MKNAGKMGSNSQKLWFNGEQVWFNQENWEKGGLSMKNLDFSYERWQLCVWKWDPKCTIATSLD
jgi:hypothetical protein